VPDGVRIIIYDSVIASWSLPGGMTWRWARQRAVRIERLAKANVRSRTGELMRSISVEAEGARPNQVIMNVYAGAAHGLWVHEGTTGPITAGGRWMRLPAWGPHPTTYVKSVRGQRANPFLVDALRVVMADL
jgi:hypothetical protein